MKLVDISRGEYGRTDYRTQDHRFRVSWTERQGARSGYVVHDTRTDKRLRADNLGEAHEAIRELIITSATDAAQPALQPDDALYFVYEIRTVEDEPQVWEVQSRRVAQVRIDGWRFVRDFGPAFTQKWSQLDRHYHRTPEAAIEAFIAGKRNAIETARSEITEAERAIVWATSLANTTGQPPRKTRRKT